MERELQAKRARMQRLTEEAATWRKEVEDRVDELRIRANQRVRERMDGFWERTTSAFLKERGLVNNPQVIAEDANAEIGLTLGEVTRWASEEAENLQRLVQHAMGLNLRSVALEEPAVSPIVMPPSAAARRQRRDSLDGPRADGFKLIAETATLTVGGIPDVAGIIQAIARIIGRWFGDSNHARSVTGPDVAAVIEDLRPQRDRVRNDLEDAITRSFGRLHTAIVTELDRTIAVELESLTAALREMADAHSRRARQSADALGRLESERDRLRAAVRRAADIETRAGGTGQWLLPQSTAPEGVAIDATLPVR
jgi:hypothetical protein